MLLNALGGYSSIFDGLLMTQWPSIKVDDLNNFYGLIIVNITSLFCKTSNLKIMRNTTSIIFSQQILVGSLLQVFNLNPILKLLSYPLVRASNNLPHKICYKNIVNIAFLIYFQRFLTMTIVQLISQFQNIGSMANPRFSQVYLILLFQRSSLMFSCPTL